MTEFNSKNYSEIKPSDCKCATCIYLLTPLVTSTRCKNCIFRKESPNYKKDIRLTNMHLDDFPELKNFFKEENKSQLNDK